jgi:hypothetical protein
MLPCASARAPGATVGSALAHAGAWCARMNMLHDSSVYSSLILAYTGAAALHGGHQVA